MLTLKIVSARSIVGIQPFALQRIGKEDRRAVPIDLHHGAMILTRAVLAAAGTRRANRSCRRKFPKNPWSPAISCQKSGVSARDEGTDGRLALLQGHQNR
jgi:hypothetical protein